MMHLTLLPNWLKKENLQEHKILVTYEAIYDIVNAEENIRRNFGEKKAKEYLLKIYSEIKALSTDATFYGTSGFQYRGYTIFKKPVSPSIIFWIIKNNIVHILRVPREEYDWHNFFKNHQNYEYNYPN